MGIADVPVFIKLGIPLASVGFLFNIVGYATNAWYLISVSGKSLTTGLWKLCSPEICLDIPEKSVDSSFKTIRAVETLGFLVGFACIILLVLYMLVSQKKLIVILAAAAGICAGILVFIGIIIYATDNKLLLINDSDGSYGYSFILSIIGGILYVAAGVISLVALKPIQ